MASLPARGGSEHDLEALEARMLEVGAARGAGLRVRLAERLGLRPGLEGRAGLPHRVRRVEGGLLVARSAQQVELPEARDLVEVGLARAPELLEDGLRTLRDPEAVHGDEHDLLLSPCPAGRP